MENERNLTPGEAMAQLLSASTPEEKVIAQQALDAANIRLVESAARQGISMTFVNSSVQGTDTTLQK
jgi:hypothetical protein